MCLFVDLHEEILVHIFEHLDGKSVKSASLVCKRFEILIYSFNVKIDLKIISTDGTTLLELQRRS